MAGTVKPIDRRSVHQICSGQVVLNLATAIKELVENSLDAGATNIEIKLKEYGSETIEVSDNGSGVEESNFQGLTLKHHTSKLQDFSDLSSVDTFGFRGEALSSLCALSDLCIVTCHRSAAVGTKLTYDRDGKILTQVHCPRQQGATVTLQNVFSTLPVRHKEFLRNLKKEFTKMAQVLQAYCIIASGVKLTCTNQTGKGKKSLVVSTNGSSSLKENIANVFGSKQLQSLLEFKQCVPTAELCEEYGLKLEKLNHAVFKISGFISKCDHGQGRSATDRQFCFINRRPCDFPKVTKLINEVYHMYNRHQYPFIVLDISLAKDSVDVNVTPDKRKVLVQEEKTLLVILKASLQIMFEPRSSSYEVNQKPMASVTPSSASLSNLFGRRPGIGPDQSPKTQSSKEMELSSVNGLKLNLSNLKRSFANANFPETTESTEKRPKQPKLDIFLSKSPESTKSSRTVSADDATIEVPDKTADYKVDSTRSCASDNNLKLFQSRTCHSVSNDLSIHRVPNCEITTDKPTETKMGVPQESIQTPIQNTSSPSHGQTSDIMTSSNSNFIPSTVSSHCTRDTESSPDIKGNNAPLDGEAIGGPQRESSVVSDSDSAFCETSTSGGSGEGSEFSQQLSSQGSPKMEEVVVAARVEMEDDQTEEQYSTLVVHRSDEFLPTVPTANRREVVIPLSLDGLKRAQGLKGSNGEDSAGFSRSFRAKIAPSDNASAEEELRREISKDMFAKMEILGQFNLGFIIAKLGQDLFIIDQHATDEKFNFENLQKHTALQGQRLIQPMPLELTAVNESILIDNLEIFKKNGFDFVIDEEGVPTQRVKLTSLPMSKNWTFGKDDIEELIFMLSDAPGVMCRPTRVRQMFASRACRKSIMIGTALNKAEMKKLVCHMGDLDQPWNCPHGRPTMRHLFNLNMMPD